MTNHHARREARAGHEEIAMSDEPEKWISPEDQERWIKPGDGGDHCIYRADGTFAFEAEREEDVVITLEMAEFGITPRMILAALATLRIYPEDEMYSYDFPLMCANVFIAMELVRRAQNSSGSLPVPSPLETHRP